MSLFISDAMANTPAASQGGGIMPIIFLVGMFAVMYLFIIRPQVKRQKAQKKLVQELQKGDEVQTLGGMMGTITELDENLIKLQVTESVILTIRRAAVEAVLPKGTL